MLSRNEPRRQNYPLSTSDLASCPPPLRGDIHIFPAVVSNVIHTRRPSTALLGSLLVLFHQDNQAGVSFHHQLPVPQTSQADAGSCQPFQQRLPGLNSYLLP